MPTAATRKGVIKHYEGLPKPIQKYFEHLPALVAALPWDVTLAYQFARVELAHNMTIYCAVVKLHRANPDLAWLAVQSQHMTRDGFTRHFQTTIGHELKKDIRDLIESAEGVRDAIMHGKSKADAVKRDAVVSVLDYACAFNAFVAEKAGIRPFGDLRGFKGRAKSLDKGTSRWLLKGIGLPLA